MRSAYGLVVRVRGRRSGTPGFGGEGTLRVALRGGSGAGERGALEWPQNVFPSRAYRGVLDGVSEGSRNLTERLTWHLTASLTEHLPRGLTFSGFRGVEQPSKRMSGHGYEAVTTLGLGLGQNFRDDAVVDADSLREHVLPPL